MKKLYKSKQDKKISGVIGGLAEYFEVDSTVLRIAWIAILIFTGVLPGLILYFIASYIMPERSGS